MSGLYLHIPFCVRRCLYCAFYVEPLGKGPISKRLRDHHELGQGDFLEALARELLTVPETFTPTTLYLGGGTPTELSFADLDALFDLLHERVDLSGVEEWTCESNPGTLTREKTHLLLDRGVTRLSLGVQSFHDPTLEFLGRLHTAKEAIEGFYALREAGAKNVNLDLLFNVPGVSMAQLEEDLAQLVALGPEHITCYPLDFETGSSFTVLRDKGFLSEIEGEEASEQYDAVRKRLTAAGYVHYELFSFARPGFTCRHHEMYWRGGTFYGLGPSAHSHVEGVRWENVRNLSAYCEKLKRGESIRSNQEKLGAIPKAKEQLMTGLRRREGVSRSQFREQTGFDYLDLCSEAIETQKALGLIIETGTYLRLTDKALFISNSVLSEFI